MNRNGLLDWLINSGIIDWENGVKDCPPTMEDSACDDHISCHNCWMKFLTKDYKTHKVDTE